MKCRHLLALGVLAAAALPASASAHPGRHHDPPAPAGAVLRWNAITQREVVPPPPAAAQPQPSSMSSMAFVQAAVYNAVVAIEGGYEPYGAGVARRPGASVDAAVATAAHDVLVHYFPARAGQLDADLSAALGEIPEGRSKDRGAAVGREAAQQIVARRAGDGWFADIGFTMPAPAPGVWQLPTGQTPLVPWLSRLRPFTLRRTDQFRPSSPPALSSRRYAKARAEVEAVGKIDSAVRSVEQTLIACFDAKYHYLFWRPSFAIPGWTPLLATPPRPEYPSAHSCLTFAQASVFKRFLGTRRIDVDLRSFPEIAAMPTRHFATAGDLKREIVDARVWGGIHFRFSNEIGGELGSRVASWALDRFFRPA